VPNALTSGLLIRTRENAAGPFGPYPGLMSASRVPRAPASAGDAGAACGGLCMLSTI
jgi:hypothetical protein